MSGVEKILTLIATDREKNALFPASWHRDFAHSDGGGY